MITDRPLYQDPRPGPRLASPAENARVRALYLKELRRSAEVIAGRSLMAANNWVVDETSFGHARKRFAYDWVDLCKREGVLGPGEQQRAEALLGEDVRERHADAAKTRLRNFQEGRDLLGWMLVQIEAVICDRAGSPLPGGFYQQQEQIPGL